jgi:hypothetical protein
MTDKTRTITLSNRPPVKISEATWPVIAKGDWTDNMTIPSQANRKAFVRVRQHADGRMIVYGTYSTQFAGELDAKAGMLLAVGDDVAAAISRVVEDLGDLPRLASECIADLPAEEI